LSETCISRTRGIETLFGNVAAVYPQPYIPVFGNKKKIIFLVGLINFHCRATGLLLLVVIFQLSDFLINSMAPLFKTSNNGACVVIF
jgi:hypothetical protein